jgi:hypothetical protein
LQTFRHEGMGSPSQGGGANKPLSHSSDSPPQLNTIRSLFFGVFADLQECDAARADMIAKLDDRGERFWHQRDDAPTITTVSGGVAVTQQMVLKERKDVTFCEPGIYSPGKPSKPSPEIAKNDETTGAATSSSTDPIPLEAPPGSVKHWVAPRPFTRVVPGTSEVVEILSAKGRELIFMVKPDVGGKISSETSTAFGTTTTSTANLTATNILLLNDNGEVVANLRIKIADPHNHDVRQGQDGTQVYRQDNPNYIPPKGKK